MIDWSAGILPANGSVCKRLAFINGVLPAKKIPRNFRFSLADFLKKAKCLNDASLFIFVFIVLCHNELDVVPLKNQKNILCISENVVLLHPLSRERLPRWWNW
ncbi:MAG: hypothetical protein IKQ53_02270 [Bacteroidales bacterium]|nr:hypothetical protein [Bacteroidales bacterium]